MKINFKILFFIFFAVSMGLRAFELSSFEVYLLDKDLLVRDIQKMNITVLNTSKEEQSSFLAGMNLLLKNIEENENLLLMNSLVNLANSSGWKNVEKISIELQGKCEDEKQRNIIECKKGLSYLRSFVLASNLSEINKSAIVDFVDNFGEQFSTIAQVDESFIQKFNTSVARFNSLIKESEAHLAIANDKKEKKWMPIPIKKPVVDHKETVRSTTAIPLSFFSFSKKYGKEFLSFLILMILLYGVSSYNRKNRIKNFYRGLFVSARKSKFKIRIFGKIGKNDIDMVTKIQNSLCLFVESSRPLGNKLNLSIKNRKENIQINLEFQTSKTIDGMAVNQKDQKFESSFRSLQKIVEKMGGEVIVLNQFSSGGEVIKSSLNLQLNRNAFTH